MGAAVEVEMTERVTLRCRWENLMQRGRVLRGAGRPPVFEQWRVP